MSATDNPACFLRWKDGQRLYVPPAHKVDTICRDIAPFIRYLFVERADKSRCHHEYHAVCQWARVPLKRWPNWYAFPLHRCVLLSLLADTVRNEHRTIRMTMADGYDFDDEHFVLLPVPQKGEP